MLIEYVTGPIINVLHLCRITYLLVRENESHNLINFTCGNNFNKSKVLWQYLYHLLICSTITYIQSQTIHKFYDSIHDVIAVTGAHGRSLKKSHSESGRCEKCTTAVIPLLLRIETT